jgi:pimeloyl-ACP methyl ester carboxylesterase
MSAADAPAPGPVAVLVHGGTFTSKMWDGVRAHLTTPSIAVDLPGRRYRPADLGWVRRSDWVESVSREIDDAGLADVVLVGHSSGGYVLPGVAARMVGTTHQLHCLVFVAATVPAEGTRPVDYLREDIRALAIETETAMIASATGRTIGGLEDGEPPIDTALELVENGPRMGLEAPRPLFEPFTWAGFPSEVPRYYVRCLRDEVIPPELADRMIANMRGATVVDLDGGHSAYRTHPGEMARIIDTCAGAGRSPSIRQGSD